MPPGRYPTDQGDVLGSVGGVDGDASSGTALTRLVGTEVPVVSAPMAGVAGGRLAAAVSGAGALGMIGVGASASPEWIVAESAVAAVDRRPFGIGLMAWALDADPTPLDAVVATRPTLVSVSFGDPAPYVGALHDAGIVVATQVGDVEGALAALDAGVDVIVARGGEAGGHGLNTMATLPLLDAVLTRAGPVPVLAAGAVTNARGVAAVLAAGAAGAWVGTAFLACPEALNSPAARARVCAARGEDTVFTSVFDIAQSIPWPEPYAGRALRNTFTDAWHGRETDLAADPDAARRLAEARAVDDYDVAYIYAGQGVGAVATERPAADVVATLRP